MTRDQLRAIAQAWYESECLDGVGLDDRELVESLTDLLARNMNQLNEQCVSLVEQAKPFSRIRPGLHRSLIDHIQALRIECRGSGTGNGAL